MPVLKVVKGRAWVGALGLGEAGLGEAGAAGAGDGLPAALRGLGDPRVGKGWKKKLPAGVGEAV